MAACLFQRNSAFRAVLTRSLLKVEALSCYSAVTEASSEEFKMNYLDDGTEPFSKYQEYVFVSLDFWAYHMHSTHTVHVKMALRISIGGIAKRRGF